jgi:hypothetical protein
VVEYHLLHLLVYLLHLSQNHTTFPLDLTGAEGWVLDEVGEDVYSWETKKVGTTSSRLNIVFKKPRGHFVRPKIKMADQR